MRRIVSGLILLVVIGCGPKGPVSVPVRGTVTFDGKPLAEGKISFITPGRVPEMMDVKDGKFEGKVKTGKKRVEVAAYRPVRIPPEYPEYLRAQMKSGNGKENLLPNKYHSESTLEADVTEKGENDFKFDLTSTGQ